MSDRVTFGDLRTAAYCPRKCYYARRDDDREPPDRVGAVRELAFRYPDLLTADTDALADLPIEPPVDEFRANLRASSRHDAWAGLTDPAAREVRLEGKDAAGVAHKVLRGPPRPSLVSPGQPPERGVWEPQRVGAVAAAKALAWECEHEVERAYVEYPAHGVVRTVELTTRNRAAYRRTLRAVRSIDGPPARLHDRSKCDPCEYADECGVRTRSLRSLLGGDD